MPEVPVFGRKEEVAERVRVMDEIVEDAEAPLDDWELLAYARYSSEDEDIVDYLREKGAQNQPTKNGENIARSGNDDVYS